MQRTILAVCVWEESLAQRTARHLIAAKRAVGASVGDTTPKPGVEYSPLALTTLFVESRPDVTWEEVYQAWRTFKRNEGWSWWFWYSSSGRLDPGLCSVGRGRFFYRRYWSAFIDSVRQEQACDA